MRLRYLASFYSMGERTVHRTDSAAKAAPSTHLTLFLVVALFLVAGCGGRRDSRVAAEPLPIREPVPTFTPTNPPPQGATAPPQEQMAAPGPAMQPQENTVLVPEVPTAIPSAELPGMGGPVNPSAIDPNAPPSSEVEPAANTVVLEDPPLGIINTELVNGRSGPDTNYEVVLVLGRGEDYDITGKSADGSWWRLCCAEDREIWAMAEFVDTDGLVDALPVAQAGEASAYAAAKLTATSAPPVVEVNPPAPTPAPVAEVAAPADAPSAATADDSAAEGQAVAADAVLASSESGGFELVSQERFPETNVVRVFLYVYAESEALEGYSLRVTKDGVELAADGESWGGQAGLTWPIADERQRFQNFKVEFPGVAPAGAWTVELTKGGAVVGPPATFTLESNDPNQELYVRYLLK